MQQHVEDIKDELQVANDHITDLQHSNASALAFAKQMSSEPGKSRAPLLENRSARFLEFRSGKEEEIHRVKAAAKRRVKAIMKQHGLEFELSREEALRYRLQRAPMKEIVGYENKITKIMQ